MGSAPESSTLLEAQRHKSDQKVGGKVKTNAEREGLVDRNSFIWVEVVVSSVMHLLGKFPYGGLGLEMEFHWPIRWMMLVST